MLSRVTLGADVAITSVILDAAKQRFPNANIYFVGPQKSWELFAADRAAAASGRSHTAAAERSTTGSPSGRSCAKLCASRTASSSIRIRGLRS